MRYFHGRPGRAGLVATLAYDVDFIAIPTSRILFLRDVVLFTFYVERMGVVCAYRVPCSLRRRCRRPRCALRDELRLRWSSGLGCIGVDVAPFSFFSLPSPLCFWLVRERDVDVVRRVRVSRVSLSSSIRFSPSFRIPLYPFLLGTCAGPLHRKRQHGWTCCV